MCTRMYVAIMFNACNQLDNICNLCTYLYVHTEHTVHIADILSLICIYKCESRLVTLIIVS